LFIIVEFWFGSEIDFFTRVWFGFEDVIGYLCFLFFLFS
jgi:hypothetical protein